MSQDGTKSQDDQTAPEVAPARAAATLMLLRPAGADAAEGAASSSPAGLEVFTFTRAATMAFSPHATAFPGGRVDPADDLPAPLWEGTDLHAWAARLGLGGPLEHAAADVTEVPGEVAAGRVLAAVVRETFEETGVLLARRASDGAPVDPEVVAGLPEDTRARVEAHELDFGSLLESLGLRPDAEALLPWSRWITPVSVPRRYDTFFFGVALPEGQAPDRLSTEATSWSWSSPAALHEGFRAGRLNLMTPTWWQLHELELAQRRSSGAAAEALEAVRAHAERLAPLRSVMLSPHGDEQARAREFTHAAEYFEDLRAFRANKTVEETTDNIN